MSSYFAINASALCAKRKTGVEWYTWQLLKYLAWEWDESDPRVVLFVPRNYVETPAYRQGRQNFASLLRDIKNLNWQIKLLRGKFLWTQYHLLKFLKRHPPSVLFSPSYVSPRLLTDSIPAVTVVHGLEGEYHPEFKTVKQIITEHLWVIPAIKKNHRLIAVSAHTKNDLNYFYGIPLEKIKTVISGPGTLDDSYNYNVEMGLEPISTEEKIKFLFLGGSERKNSALALKIFRSLKKQIKNLSIVSNPTYISEKEKIKQLKSAHFLFYPSFYEGFGFPVLEAQACGAVPIVRKGSGLRETGGEGVIEYDPDSEDKSLNEIASLIKDPKKYSQMQKKGLKNVQRYSWRQCAREVKKILLEVHKH